MKKKSTVELEKALVAKREELRAFRFGEAGGRTRNVRAGRIARREIARILTELRTRQLSETQASVAKKAKTA
jgi:ribosomal protein L29